MFHAQRRSLLRATLGGVVSIASAPVMAAIAAPSRPHHRSLSFRHLHTGEILSVPYWVGGRYEPDALSEIDKLLRDFRSGEITNMDVGLLEFLHRLRTALASDRPFEIISGYRSPPDQRAPRGKKRRSRKERLSHAGHGHRYSFARPSVAGYATGCAGFASRWGRLLRAFQLYPSRYGPRAVLVI